MKKLLVLMLLTLPFNIFAETIIACKSPKGYSYHLPGPFVKEEMSGWTKDGVSKGKWSVIKNNDEIDILFIDATDEIISARADGGTVVPIGISENQTMFSILVNYPNNVVEIFTFDMKNKKFFLSGHKYGERSRIKKSYSMVGECN